MSPRTVRLRFSTRDVPIAETESLMLDGPVSVSSAWAAHDEGDAVVWTGEFGSVRLERDPWHVEFRDAQGRLVTRTRGPGEPAT